MKRRLVILTEIISPYRIPLFNALASQAEIDLHVIFLSETDPSLRQWRVYKEEIRFSYDVLPSWRKRLGRYNVLLNSGLGQALTSAAPHVILCGGYSYLASWHGLIWARAHRTPFLLWSESNLQDSRRGLAPVEFLKNEFLRRCSAFVVPGQSAAEYLRFCKIAEERIFTAPNAVENDFFTAASANARANAAEIRTQLGLPERYFLFAGRLVPEKGIFDLLAAYDKLDDPLRKQVGLVFVGDGPSRSVLEDRAAAISPGTVKFAGFAQREQLAKYYALAEMLILPTYTDTWGLVVNEAMACGLPVILSRAAGCASDLVQNDYNGALVPASDVAVLASAMNRLAQQPELCRTMGARSAERIARFSPAAWAEGIVRTVETIRGEGD